MTRDELAAKTRINLDDGGVFYSADDLNDSIQDGYEEVAGYTGSLFKASRIALTANKSYYDFGNLIPDYLGVAAIWNTNTKRWMFPVDNRQLESLRHDWEIATGNPYLFWPVNLHFVAVFPRVTTTSGYMYVFYRAKANLLTGSDTPNLPAEYQDVLEFYSTADLFEQAEEYTKAGINFKQYAATIELIKRATRSFRLPDHVERLI